MLPVAIVLLVLILLFAVGAIASNPEPVTLEVFVAQIPTNLAVVFIVGMATAFAFIAALGLLWAGIRRQRAASRSARADGTGKSSKAVKGSRKDKSKDRDGGRAAVTDTTSTTTPPTSATPPPNRTPSSSATPPTDPGPGRTGPVGRDR